MEKSFCFNSINGDRKYKAEDFREYFATFIGNGVFPNPSTNLQCIGENGDMTVTLKTGNGWINGALYVNDADLILPIDVADGVLNRIDRIVLRMDTLGRAINAVVKKGAFASSPVAPVLQRDADGYEIGIADIYIAAGATQITQANITDLRLNTSLCGIVHGTVEQVDTTTLFNQYLSWLTQKKAQYDADMVNWTSQKQTELNNYISDRETDFNNWYNNITSVSQTEIDNMEAHFQQDWNNWFATVQSALDGDTAGNLLNLINTNTSNINSLAGEGRTTETVKGNADAIANLTEDFDEHKADYAYQIPQISGTQIRINRLSNTNRLFFQLTSDLTGGEITISTDGGTTSKPLKDVDDNAVTILEKGFVEVVADANFFTLRNRGISATQKQALIDIVNNAEANQSTIKANIANALNSKTDSSLTSSSSWIDVENTINNMPNKKYKNGYIPSSSNMINVSGLSFKPSIITVVYGGTSFGYCGIVYDARQSTTEYTYISGSGTINKAISTAGGYINSTGFNLLLPQSGYPIYWFACE